MDIKEQVEQLIKQVMTLDEQLSEMSFSESLVRNPITPKEVQEVEGALSVALPEEYKEFLQIYGSLDLSGTVIYGEDRASMGIGVGVLGLGEFDVVGKTQNLRETYPERFPKNFVPILESPDIGAVCLICGGENRGKVVLWGYYADYDSPESDCAPEGPDFWTWLRNELLTKKKGYEEQLARPM